MFTIELAKAARRWRTWALAAVLGAVPVLFVVALVVSPPPAGDADGPPFLTLSLRNGLFAPLAALAILQPFFLPLTTALLAGDAVAGEASAGTLRYLLVRPVGRARLVLAKYGSVLTLLCLAVTWVGVVALVAGAWAFGIGPLATLSGGTLEVGATLLRIVAASAYVVAGVAGLAAVGLLVSTLTDSGPGATVATMAFAIVSQILGALSSLRALHPYLLSDHWLAFVGLFRSPVDLDPMIRGLVVFAAYSALFLAAAVAVMTRRDVHA
jgi:ABC-2 type transport system permease protein